MDKEIFIQHAIDLLNQALKDDPETLLKLYNNREISTKIGLPIQHVMTLEGPKIGMMGIINGILSILDDGLAIIGVHGEWDENFEKCLKIEKFVDARLRQQFCKN